MYDVETIRADFPILSRKVHDADLVYLDNAASAQKPRAVIDAVTRAYAEEYSNVHRGLHYLSNLATDRFEAVRGTIARVLGAVLKWVEVDAKGDLDPQAVADAITDRTRLVAISHMSNVLGTVTDARRIAEIAHERGVPVLVDGCQAAVHMPVNVSEIGADFYVVTGHKLYGPSGSGAVYIHRDRLAEMRPFLGGGDMIREVHRDTVTYNDAPHKFEAGTPNIVQMIGLGAALDYLEGLGMENVAAHETALRDYAQSRLGGLNWLQVHGNSATKGAIFSFSMEGGAHPHDISTIIDRKGVAVRAGHHCAQPLMQHLGVAATARASFGLYNTTEEVDRLVDALELCHELFG
jgi:cysteine desulfurase/selenocysteine lyase